MATQRLHGLPDRARTWAAGLASSPIVEVAAIGGGATETKWLLHVAQGDPLVIRWCEPQVWGVVGREHVGREVLACRLLAGTGLPVPTLIGSDPDGVSAGGAAT